MDVTIRPMSASDWPRVRAIHEAGIATGNATFQTEAPAWEEWRHRLRMLGRRERVGEMHGRWRDVLLLERRSGVVGTS